MKHEFADTALKASPPLTISGMALAGITLQDWVLICTLVYTMASLFFLLRREWRAHKERNDEQSKRERSCTPARGSGEDSDGGSAE